MKVTFWGTRGSLAAASSNTVRYGGNTSCVAIEGSKKHLIILDAGTGIQRLGVSVPADLKRVDIFLTHLHMDHIQGLPFFIPLRRPGTETHIWGPASTTMSLSARLQKYLSPPLFPVSVRELAVDLHFHEMHTDKIELEEFSIQSQMIIHPNPTIGYRIECENSSITYIPDHEPALGSRNFPTESDWTSGYQLARDTDLLIHDAQYTSDEYHKRVGFGHSDIKHALQFAELANVKQFVPFHYDPLHTDDELDTMIEQAVRDVAPSFQVTASREGLSLDVEC